MKFLSKTLKDILSTKNEMNSRTGNIKIVQDVIVKIKSLSDFRIKYISIIGWLLVGGIQQSSRLKFAS
jgi:hypothetical protein